MAKKLRITFYPPHDISSEIVSFSEKLKDCLQLSGATVIPFEEALDRNSNKILPDIVVIEQGVSAEDDMAMYRLTSLHKNPLVSIYHAPCPVDMSSSLQSQLNSIVEVLTWNLTHIPIFVHNNTWTVCTMNGAVIPCGDIESMQKAVHHTLIPKLAAQLIPPSKAGFIYRTREFNPLDGNWENLYSDFVAAAHEWTLNGLMLAHTTIEELNFKSLKAKRFAEMYLDNRTGMSYGFMSYQLPLPVKVAELQSSHSNGSHINPDVEIAIFEVAGKLWKVAIPPVHVMSTRSGCKKTSLIPATDIVRITWQKRNIYFDIPSAAVKLNCRPSYDTIAIMSHAVGNYIVASILKAMGDFYFSKNLSEKGISISHWHGYPIDGQTPPDYLIHGSKNPPVSCSTPQSAIYALLGKLHALSNNFSENYKGDVHIEPHHGTVVNGVLSLKDTAKWAGEFSKLPQTEKSV